MSIDNESRRKMVEALRQAADLLLDGAEIVSGSINIGQDYFGDVTITADVVFSPRVRTLESQLGRDEGTET